MVKRMGARNDLICRPENDKGRFMLQTTQRPWGLKARQGHKLHRICAYQASFPPQLPAFFLDRYAKPGVVVLDPFSGRGTTLLEATLRGCKTYGVDLLPVAVLLSRVKIACPPLKWVLSEVAALDLEAKVTEPQPEEFTHIFHLDTWNKLCALRSSKCSDVLMALALGRLHGHSPGFFSVKTFNVISIPPTSFARQNQKHGSSPEPRDVKAILERAAYRFIPEDGIAGEGKVFEVDAREIPLDDGSVDLVVTSPPFLDVVDYEDVNWLRGWFLGEGPPLVEPFFTRSVDHYREFLRAVLTELARIVRHSGLCVMEVGNVKRKHNMLSIVLEAAEGLWRISDLVHNNFSGQGVPKISRAMVGGGETATTQNQCVVFEKE